MVVKIFEDINSDTLEEDINNYIKLFNNDNIDISYQMALNEDGVLYSAMVIIKDER